VYRIDRGQQLAFTIGYRYHGNITRETTTHIRSECLRPMLFRALAKLPKPIRSARPRPAPAVPTRAFCIFDYELGQLVDSQMKAPIVVTIPLGIGGGGELPAKSGSSFFILRKLLEQ
jgi:hypothetical protein